MITLSNKIKLFYTPKNEIYGIPNLISATEPEKIIFENAIFFRKKKMQGLKLVKNVNYKLATRISGFNLFLFQHKNLLDNLSWLFASLVYTICNLGSPFLY